MNLKLASALFISAIMVFSSCKKEETSNEDSNATLRVSITDAPGDYQHIYLMVEEIAVRNGGNWATMTLNQVDTFDILDYTNGNQLILAEGSISADSTDEIRLVLADNNTLVLQDSSVHYLKVPSGSSSGLKIKLDSNLSLQGNQTYYVVLDFDACKSIIKKGNGDYQLKPVIRGYWDEGKGEIEGVALSPGFQVSVAAISGPDTVGSTIADSTGYFKIIGLPGATYSVFYESSNTNDSLIGGVAVMQNMVTQMDTVNL